MNKSKFFFCLYLIIFLFVKKLNALEVVCNFEEIYKNGQTQQGFILISNENLRYQYYDQNLYKIIFNDNKLTLIMNKHNEIENFPTGYSALIQNIHKIFQQFPNISNEIFIDDMKFKTELNQDNTFIRRLAIVSNKINMSIYFYDCETKPINGIFFKSNPVFEYKFK